MQLKPKSFRHALGVLVALVALSIVASAQDKIKIKNFGQMDERFYRGAQPKEADFKDLAALGIKTVIDLREDTPKYEKEAVAAAGMKYINIPMRDKKYPTEEAVQAFLKVVNDPDTGKFFVHCAGGRHRTGAMGAVYRSQFYHWHFDQIYQEMKQYDFYTSWGHGAFKDFVQDYCARMESTKVSSTIVPDNSQAPTAPSAAPLVPTKVTTPAVTD
ncbi:MAG: tyrosine-protein phosphatase, partial [Acidobacteria bacterium]|nr:tyrosine-protein phosphatase [Acidobacteriota bacterium]